MQWVKDFLERLTAQDSRGILNLVLYLPYEGETVQEKLESQSSRLFQLRTNLDIGWTVEKEWSAEAGNMAVLGA